MSGLIDIDDFKKYNDRFGHLQGDSSLALLGDFLMRKTEGTPVTAFRYGGEEFTLAGCDAWSWTNPTGS